MTYSITKENTHTLNLIADFIFNKTNVDVRLETKSRKGVLPELRALFFVIALDNLNISHEKLAYFLNKNHATINHANKMWNNFLKKEYNHFLPLFKKHLVKVRFNNETVLDSELAYINEILRLEEIIKELIDK